MSLLSMPDAWSKSSSTTPADLMHSGPVLVDTDTLSEVSRGHALAVSRARGYLLAHGRFTISAVTVFERLRGYHVAIRGGKPFHRQLQAFEALVSASLVLPFEEDAASVAATIWAACTRAQRQSLGDILILATSLARQLPLVTRNRKDFDGLLKVSDLSLQLIDWTGKTRTKK
jgi:tRNA(fMet)-specific endonuclease VapC